MFGLVFGISALVTAAVVVFLRYRQSRERIDCPRCGHCDYDLTGHVGMSGSGGEVCPECGRLFREAGIIAPGTHNPGHIKRRQLAQLVVLAVFFSAVYGYGVIASLPRQGWQPIVFRPLAYVLLVWGLIAIWWWWTSRRR